MAELPVTVKIPTEAFVEILADLRETEGTSEGAPYRRLVSLVGEQSLRVRIIDAVEARIHARATGDADEREALEARLLNLTRSRD